MFEFKALGLRFSNALVSDAKTDSLIMYLDTFKSYGINSFSVFWMGSRFGNINGFLPDASLNPVYTPRMERIIEAADARGMIMMIGGTLLGRFHGKGRPCCRRLGADPGECSRNQRSQLAPPA